MCEIRESCEDSEVLIAEFKKYGHIYGTKLHQDENSVFLGIVTFVDHHSISSSALYVLQILPNGVRGVEWAVLIDNVFFVERITMVKPGNFIAFSFDCVNRKTRKIEVGSNNDAKVWCMQRKRVDTPVVVPLFQINTPQGYRTISQLVDVKKDVNIFAVVRKIIKKTEFRAERYLKYHAIVAVQDESCQCEQLFNLHIFFNKVTEALHNQELILETDSIIRVRHMKTEVYCDVLDGRVFSSSNIVTCIPRGDSFDTITTAQNCCLTDQERKYVKHLIKWNKERQSFINNSWCPAEIDRQASAEIDNSTRISCTQTNHTSQTGSSGTNIQVENDLTLQTLCTNTSINEYTFSALRELGLQNIYKVNVAITKIEPHLSSSKLDFVSGTCSECDEAVLYSKISRRLGDKLVCPTCVNAGKMVELQLLFKLQLELTDEDGKHLTASVTGENAENLFGCTVANFLQTPTLRYDIHVVLAELMEKKVYIDMCLVPTPLSTRGMFEISHTTYNADVMNFLLHCGQLTGYYSATDYFSFDDVMLSKYGLAR